jgi:hypothetical protein
MITSKVRSERHDLTAMNIAGPPSARHRTPYWFIFD